MQSWIFPDVNSARAALAKIRFGWLGGVMALATLTALVANSNIAQAQVPNPVLTEQPSQKNPVPRAGGDAQNRNRAGDDKYWGVLDANRRWYASPFSRLPDQLLPERGNGFFQKDGWQFPRLASQSAARQVLDFGGEQQTTTLPISNFTLGSTTPAGTEFIGSLWATVTGPSTQVLGTAGAENYQRTPAVPRPATAIPNNTSAPDYAPRTIKWYPNISGNVGTLRRFSIRIYLPTPQPFPDDGTLASETRVEDARYVVYYQRARRTNDPEPVSQVYVTRSRTFLKSQSGSGWVTLTDNSGQPILFPMATEASVQNTTYTGGVRPRVELDNTTEGELNQRFVIADQIQFVPAGELAEIKAPTTVTPIHGGRKIPRPATFTALPAEPYDPAKQLFQPAWTDLPASSPYNPVATPGTVAAFTNDSFNFINNPRDVNYTGNPETALATPLVPDTVYTDTTSPFYEPFEPWNPSTLFQGPRALIDDQTDPATPGFEFGRQPVLRTNQNRYQDGSGNPIPLFSQMQVLVPRTEYVTDPNSTDGLGTIAVGCVYSVDWLTGTPLWRFPDRTYLPLRMDGTAYQDEYKHTVVRSGLRNPNTTDAAGNTIPTVPGIGAYDKNGDGYISDDEVYIVGQGANTSGSIEAGITIVPRIYTRGVISDPSDSSKRTQVPLYDDAWNPYATPTPGIQSDNTNTSPIVGVIDVPQGRYATTDAAQKAVEAGMAIVAANNGVVYAIDPYGNNDSRYYNYQTGGTEDTTKFGTYRAGSTNILWTFSVTAPTRTNTERDEEYNQRLKQSVPATGPWGHSTPVIAYQREDYERDETTANKNLNRFIEEPRLFIGNSNGVLYALNAAADAGRWVTTIPATPGVPFTYVPKPFPFRKLEHNVYINEPLDLALVNPTPDLRWWFETEGAITAAPAVSASQHPLLPSGTTPTTKGVYVTSNDGRIYCLDWSGPVSKTSNDTSLTYAGTAASAELLNDNYRFHNANSTKAFAKADGTEGKIRPRWVYPSRYRDISGSDNILDISPFEDADVSVALGNDYRVERQARFAPINSAPSLMDFPFKDPTTNEVTYRRYVVAAVNDLNGSDPVIRGRVLLLDQVGDRRDFSVKPVKLDVAGGTGVGGTKVAFGQPEDMYAPTEFLFSDATPAWTYRSVYTRYNDAGITELVQSRNRPGQLFTPTTGGGTADDPASTDPTVLGLPEKRNLPTVFAGGPNGRLYALDIDPQTGLFLRWRGNLADTKKYVPLPSQYTDARDLPANEPESRRLNPASPILSAVTLAGGVTLNARPPLVRTVRVLNSDYISSIVVSGGPQQNRNHPYATTPTPVAGPTVPTLPTNDAPRLLNPGVPYRIPATVSTNPPYTGVRPPYWSKVNVDSALAGTAIDYTGFALVDTPAFDFTGRYVNQDHDDPAATTRGSEANPDPLVLGTSDYVSPELNRAYQHPLLAVTSTDGKFSLISTELDGQDSDAATNTEGQTAAADASLGWALTSDLQLINEARPYLFSTSGPGGAGTQVAMVTNAYYGAMDPGFRNTVKKRNVAGGNQYVGFLPFTDPTLIPNLDLSATNFASYPWFEPRGVGDVNTAPYDTPRPRFEPRSLYSGNAANASGPDSDDTTGDGWPEVKADAHTGRTGLPLDLRGLFYDKRFAANTPTNNTNDDGLLRLPAYTGIGEALPLADRRERHSLREPLSAPPSPTKYPALADGTPDVPRDSSTGATPPWRTDPFKLFPGALDPAEPDPANPKITPEADINPPGTNIAWLFVGGADGVSYAFTPNRYTVPGFAGGGGGLGSGFVGGDDNDNPAVDSGSAGNPRIVFVSKATFDAISASPRRPDPVADNLFRVGKPFYEYGETAYAIVYDIGPQNRPAIDSNNNGMLDVGTEVFYPSNINVIFRPYTNVGASAPGGATPSSVLVPGSVKTVSAGIPFTYPYDATQDTRPRDPALRNRLTAPRSIALVQFQINTNFNAGGVNGGRRPGFGRGGAVSVAWTPGVVYEASLNEFDTPGGGATEAAAIANTKPLITVANPLAIQAFLLTEQLNGNGTISSGRLATVADPAGLGRVYNGIGPFEASDAPSGSVKDRVATAATLTAGGDVTAVDPDRLASEYSQALSNGNKIIRYNLEQPVGGVRNVNYGKPFIAGSGGALNSAYEPTFYMPIASSADMIDHGNSGSTTTAGNRQTLRIVNRSLQGNLGKLRVELRSDALFRSWPGLRPNVRPTDAVSGTGLPTRATAGNPRLTPVLAGAYQMRADGIVNYLPWEQPVAASLPWERDTTTLGLASSLTNISQDYPDIDAQSDSSKGKNAVKVITASGDVTQSAGSLAASVGTTTGNRTNLTVSARQNAGDALPLVQRWDYTGNNQNFTAATAKVNIAVPKYQPANLVAMHSLTSTYVKPSIDESPGDLTSDGDIQLPRTQGTSALDRATVDRGLRIPGNVNASSAVATDPLTITPMGYTVQMRAYLDVNGDGTWDSTEPYRDFETWFGVPVDISIKQQGSVVELPGATNGSSFAHGFGQQNGYYGYGLNTATVGTQSLGFLPPFLQDAAVANLGDPYNRFYAPLTIQSESNVNLWNVRASQKISSNPNGSAYTYFAMQSDSVDPRFGVLAVEADPLGTNPSGIMPNVVTSLDKKFDTAWDNIFQSNNSVDFNQRLFTADFNPLLIPASGVAGDPTRYAQYYAGFGGRHTLHKAIVGSSSPSVLSVPDAPSASLPPASFNNVFLPPFSGQKPAIGVAVPLGTPAGTYSNSISGTPLAFFEDFDTYSNAFDARYYARPIAKTSTTTQLIIGAAGPLYNGQNYLHPGTIARNLGNLQNNVINGEGILRPRVIGVNGGGPVYNYLPSTTVTTSNSRVAFDVKVTVGEAALTGQVADQTLAAGITFPASIVQGILPAINNVPLFDYNNIPTGGTARPVSTLAPAAYRMANGNLVVFYNANWDYNAGVREGNTIPGAPFRLFRNVLTWNTNQGTWLAASTGIPIDGTQVFDPSVNIGQWFNDPERLPDINDPNESNLSPFILHDPLLMGGLSAAEPTLLVMNYIPTSNGEGQYTPYYASLAGGTPSAFQSLLPRTGNNRLDTSIRRFGPRAVYVPGQAAALVFYYGSSGSKNNLYYVAAPANNNGGITGQGTTENLLRLPAAVTSSSEPMPVVRRVRISQLANGVYVYDPNGTEQYVVDVYYTANVRGGSSADICLNRFRVTGTGIRARLQPIDLPVQVNEKLVGTNGSAIYKSKNIGWYNRTGTTALPDANAPVIKVVSSGTVLATAGPGNWQLDNATKLLSQTITVNGGTVIVYVDTAAGIVTFRGKNAPIGYNTVGQAITATYLPLAYRIAGTDRIESGSFGFMDRRPVDTTLAFNPSSPRSNDVKNTIGWLAYGIQTRYGTWDNANGQGIDRQWLYWQQSSQTGGSGTVYYTTRRVGTDLVSLGTLVKDSESIKLSTASTGTDPYGNPILQQPRTVLVNVQAIVNEGAGESFVNIPFEVDYNKGRIYTQANYEGLRVRITGTKTTFVNPVTETDFDVRATLSPINEATGVDGTSGVQITQTQVSNESQPYAFLDVYDANPANVSRGVAPNGDAYPLEATDPALQPGKIWMFWSSSRGRSGLLRAPDAALGLQFGVGVGQGITTSGYNLFWETIAPDLNTVPRASQQ